MNNTNGCTMSNAKTKQRFWHFMRSNLLFLSILAIISGLSILGCSKTGVVESLPVNKEYMPVKTDTISTPEEISVYIDASQSMSGYLLDGHISEYRTFVDQFELLCTSLWGTMTIEHYSFGDSITRSRNHRLALNKQFYTHRQTHIDQVIDKAPVEQLTIIVSDMFQNNTDIPALVAGITKKYKANDMACGIFGIRSAFKGRVSDLPIKSFEYPYDSRKNVKRPFYVIVLGKPRQIELFAQQLNRQQEQINGTVHSIIIGMPLLKEPISFNSNQVESVNRLRNLKRDDQNFQCLSNAYGLKACRSYKYSTRKPNTLDTLVFTIPIQTTVAGFQLPTTRWNTRTTAYIKQNVKQKNKADQWKAKPELLTGIGIFAEPIGYEGNQPNQVKVTITVDGRKLSTNSLTLCESQLYIPVDSMQIPNWVSAWNLSDSDLNLASNDKLNDKTLQWGEKTYNLKPFVIALRDAWMRNNDPVVGYIALSLRK